MSEAGVEIPSLQYVPFGAIKSLTLWNRPLENRTVGGYVPGMQGYGNPYSGYYAASPHCKLETAVAVSSSA